MKHIKLTGFLKTRIILQKNGNIPFQHKIYQSIQNALGPKLTALPTKLHSEPDYRLILVHYIKMKIKNFDLRNNSCNAAKIVTGQNIYKFIYSLIH